MLSGQYYFRYVGYTSSFYALYGTITFSSGSYTVSATEVQNGQATAAGQTASGSYAINAGGFGFLTDLIGGGQIRGTVSNGLFIGSNTEAGYNNLFIAAQITSTGSSNFSGSYSMAYFNYPSELEEELSGNAVPYNAQFTLSPNGGGSLAAFSAQGNYLGSNSGAAYSAVTQNVPSSKYTVSGNAVVLNFPSFSNSTTLLTGQMYLYFSPDGNFVFGGGSGNNPWMDMVIGVKNNSGASALLNSSLYYNAGIYAFAGSSNEDLDSYYGSFSVTNGVVIEHNRTFSAGNGIADDSVTPGTAPTTGAATYSDGAYNYTVGDGGNIRIGVGLPPFLGIDVAVAAPSFSSGSGVYLNPTGVVNAASYAPFTAGISPGELILLTGSGLAPNSSAQVAPSVTLPTNGINGVKVFIDGISAPLFYVSSGQIAAVVPYEVAEIGTFATIQVSNNGATSKTLTEFLTAGSPGVFTIPADGVGDVAALHADYSLVSENSPAQPGETISVYLTGLGSLYPPSSDGVPGASTPPYNQTVDTVTAFIDDSSGNSTAATVSYSGLAPGYADLYQLNLTLPLGLNAGDSALEVDVLNSSGQIVSFQEQAIIPIGSGVSAALVPARAEEQNGQTYKPTKHGNLHPLKNKVFGETRNSQ